MQRRSWRVATCAVVLGLAAPAAAIAPPDVVFLAGAVLVRPLMILAAFFALPLGWLYLRSGAYRLRHLVRPVMRVLAGKGAAVMTALAALSWSIWALWGSGAGEAVDDLSRLQRSLFSQQPPRILDLRRPNDFAAWHLRDAVNIPDLNAAHAYVEDARGREPAREIVVYCQGGSSASWLVSGVLNRVDPAQRTQAAARLRYIANGSNGMRRAHPSLHLGAIRQAPRELVDRWVESGEAQRIDIDYLALIRDPTLDGVRKTATAHDKLTAIYLSGPRPDKIEARLAVTDTWPRVYAVADPQLRKAPPRLITKAAIAVQQYSGSIWPALVCLMAAQIALMLCTRLAMVGGFYDGRRTWMRGLESVFAMGLVLLAKSVSDSYADLYGKTIFATELGWGLVAALFLVLSGVTLHIHCPPSKRNRQLMRALQASYRHEPPPPRVAFRWQTIPLAAVACTVVLALASVWIPLFAFIVFGVALHAAFIVDWAIRRYFAWRLAASPKRERFFLEWVGAPFSRHPAVLRLHTRSLGNPGRFRLIGESGGELGALSATRFSAAGSIAPDTQIDPRRVAALGRKLWQWLRTDVIAHLDAHGDLVDVEPLRMPMDADGALHEQILSYAVGAVDLDSQDGVRLDATALAETLQHPTPLSLDLIQQRWAPEGGATRAFKTLGLHPSLQAEAGAHFTCVGNRLYKDVVAERRVFEGGRLITWLRRQRSRIAVEIAARTIEEDSLAWFEPRVEQDLRHLRQTAADSAIAGRKLLRIVIRALGRLSGDFAQWQEQVVFAHQQLHQRLAQDAAEAATSDRNAPGHSPVVATTYELYRRDPVRVLPAESEGLRRLRAVENCKQRLRDLYLQQVSLVGQLLDRLAHDLKLDGNPSFLNLAGLRDLKRRGRRPRLNALILERRRHWQLTAGIALPSRLALADLEREGLATLSFAASVAVSSELRGMRVSGLHAPCAGIVRVVKSLDDLPQPTADEIIVSTNLLPVEIVRLKAARGIVIEEGAALSHVAILAREMNLSVIVKAAGATTRLRDGQPICMMPDGSIVDAPAHPALCVPSQP